MALNTSMREARMAGMVAASKPASAASTKNTEIVRHGSDSAGMKLIDEGAGGGRAESTPHRHPEYCPKDRDHDRLDSDSRP